MVVNNLQNKNHNQRNKKKKRIVFICSFGLMFILSSLLLHYFFLGKKWDHFHGV